MSTTAVEKGLQFEKAVVDMLNKCGFKAWRTNQSNEADLERYKAGFDGGVDIIATFDVIKPICNTDGEQGGERAGYARRYHECGI